MKKCSPICYGHPIFTKTAFSLHKPTTAVIATPLLTADGVSCADAGAVYARNVCGTDWEQSKSAWFVASGAELEAFSTILRCQRRLQRRTASSCVAQRSDLGCCKSMCVGGKALHFREKRMALDVPGGGATDVAIFCLYLYGSSSSSEQDLLLRQVDMIVTDLLRAVHAIYSFSYLVFIAVSVCVLCSRLELCRREPA